MNFELSDEQQMIVDTVRTFVENELYPHEDVVERTGEVYPNCFVVGLSVAAVHGTPRMGPAFGAMLLSGRYGAELIKKKLKQE